VNIVAVVGNVASEPELRHTSQGRAICTFRVAVSRPGGEEADFFTVAAWERQAEVCSEYLAIGRRIAVDGRMHCRVEDKPDGTRASRIEIVAHRVELIGRAAKSAPVAEVVR
jgi:single-strand DNA-binding protein